MKFQLHTEPRPQIVSSTELLSIVRSRNMFAFSSDERAFNIESYFRTGYTLLDRKRNEEILEQLEVESVEEKITRYKFNWLDHVRRMENSRIPKIMMQYKPRGHRRPGRPLRRLLDGAETGKKCRIRSYDSVCFTTRQSVVPFLTWGEIYLYAAGIVAIGLFEHIEQRFLCNGHSFLQCDSDFTLIEKRQSDKNDLLKIVQDSKVVKPFQTVSMLESSFLNMQDVADQQISIKNLDISKAYCIQYDVSKVGSVSVK
ncbi:hypothetical protein ANN_24083 [Periplaneta americana]|uniref:Uncharacterized protein n=1 Tax=Periplaneta americana TaxID=6978 RepID=A0ABQ8S236_PERAM|nr:hypothetical protein ANN_24083 [Periplaneta americana]